jgi:hypothetical protein
MNFASLAFKNEISLGDLISAASFLIAALGLFLNWWQLRLDAIRKRAEFIVSVFSEFVMDKDSARALYDIEYDRFKYTPTFHESVREMRLDRLLYYFEKIAALAELGTISLEDLELVRYEFVRVYRNKQVQKYLTTLDDAADDVGVRGGTFERFRRVAAKLEKKPRPKSY